MQGQNWQAPPPPAEKVYDFDGKIRVMIPVRPGVIVLSLSGLKLASSGILGFVATDDGENSHTQELQSIVRLLSEGEAYQLQLEFNDEDMDSQLLLGRLCWLKQKEERCEVGFEFDDSDDDTLLFSEGLYHRKVRLH
jgi:hypothetical protein